MVFDDVKIGDMFRDSRKEITLIVTELIEEGFKYSCTPHHIYPARMGPSLVKSGELYYKLHKYVNWNNLYNKVGKDE